MTGMRMPEKWLLLPNLHLRSQVHEWASAVGCPEMLLHGAADLLVSAQHEAAVHRLPGDHTTRNSLAAAAERLPGGWEAILSRSTGGVYYRTLYRTLTQEVSTWDVPTAPPPGWGQPMIADEHAAADPPRQIHQQTFQPIHQQMFQPIHQQILADVQPAEAEPLGQSRHRRAWRRLRAMQWPRLCSG
jgi:hypothetical protein